MSKCNGRSWVYGWNGQSHKYLVISKLPFKLKEKWRGSAFEIQEQCGRRARFADLVGFIDREAKVVTDPLCGEIQSFSVGSEGKGKVISVNIKVPKKIPQKGSFVTAINPFEMEASDSTAKRTSVITASAFEKPCLFCQKNHTLKSYRVLFQRKNWIFEVKMLRMSDTGWYANNVHSDTLAYFKLIRRMINYTSKRKKLAQRKKVYPQLWSHLKKNHALVLGPEKVSPDLQLWQ